MNYTNAGSKSSNAFFGNKKKPYTVTCFECNKQGHTRRECSLWKRKQAKFQQNGNGHAKSNVHKNKEKSAFSAVYLSNTPSHKIWFVDSGASQHMSASEKGLMNIRQSSTKLINAANGVQLKVKCAGDLNVCVNGNDITIYDVLCVPELAANLLSISCITKSGNRVSFVDDGCEIYNHNGRFLCKANLEEGVYKLPIEVNFEENYIFTLVNFELN